ncbi:PepSY domain-containing protein [Streptomyces sp. NPDC047072]|uniref:PepSY domain-containing protein n=1 Tax=Streptomyces sp. NPDC047072 TaxID=3154809 RepID=UPI0033C466C4
MKRNIVIATLTAAALATGGTVTAFAAGNDDDRTATSTSASTVTAADAISAALKHTSGTALSADLGDDGADAWEVTVVKGDGTEYDVRVAADSGKVLGASRDTDDGDDRDGDDRAEFAAVKGAKTDAREAALAAAAHGTVTEVGLDDDKGSVTAWSVDTVKDGKQGEWTVDLATGKVTQDHEDGDDD